MRPGTIRRRVLALGVGEGVRATELAAAFDRCDRADLGAAERLPFLDECFEFVWCPVQQFEQLAGTDLQRGLFEILRVLRLRGVAAIDLRAAPDAADGRLVPVVVTNVGDRTWPGSGPHRLDLIVAGATRQTAVELPGSLVPGDSFELMVGLRDPIDHAVDLYVRTSSLGAEPRRSDSARIAVRASTGLEADVERAGGVVLGTFALEPAEGLGATRIYFARP